VFELIRPVLPLPGSPIKPAFIGLVEVGAGSKRLAIATHEALVWMYGAEHGLNKLGYVAIDDNRTPYPCERTDDGSRPCESAPSDAIVLPFEPSVHVSADYVTLDISDARTQIGAMHVALQCSALGNRNGEGRSTNNPTGDESIERVAEANQSLRWMTAEISKILWANPTAKISVETTCATYMHVFPDLRRLLQDYFVLRKTTGCMYDQTIGTNPAFTVRHGYRFWLSAGYEDWGWRPRPPCCAKHPCKTLRKFTELQAKAKNKETGWKDAENELRRNFPKGKNELPKAHRAITGAHNNRSVSLDCTAYAWPMCHDFAPHIADAIIERYEKYSRGTIRPLHKSWAEFRTKNVG
jgi:hypothetical protein